MTVIQAGEPGFCFGVSRAVKTAAELPKDKKTYTLGPLIHNKSAVADLEKQGIFATDDIHIAANTQSRLIIRTHGVAESVYAELERLNIDYIDLTCPFVKKIHNIVAETSADGYYIIIAGDSNHPEVIGITGYAKTPVTVLTSGADARAAMFNNINAYALIAQTTFYEEEFLRIADVLTKKIRTLKTFNTICSAAKTAVSRAVSVSKKVDVMLVFGDKTSANSKRLYNLCKKYCKKTYFLNNIKEMILKNISIDDTIGLIAGASTPPEIIEEALIRMEDIEKGAETFEEMLEGMVSLKTGDVVKGTVIQVSNTEVSVNLQYKSDGIITREEFTEDPSVNLCDIVKPGDEIEVYVARVNDSDGIVQLSKRRLDSQKAWVDIEEAFAAKTTVKGKFTRVVSGGMMASVEGLRVFIPASQVAGHYVDKDNLKRFIGREYDFNIIEFDKKNKRIVAGRKSLAIAEERETRDRIYASINVGDKLKGVVTRIVTFGAFVDLGGIDGLVHISQLSWDRLSHPSDAVKEEQEVEVTVIAIDKEQDKISLSMRTEENNPWYGVEEKYQIGDIVRGRVVRIAPFGVFVEIAPGLDGLVHISQLSANESQAAEEIVSVNEMIEVRITAIDSKRKRISLSKRAVNEDFSEPEKEGAAPVDETPVDIAEAEADSAEKDSIEAAEPISAEEPPAAEDNVEDTVSETESVPETEEAPSSISAIEALGALYDLDNTDK